MIEQSVEYLTQLSYLTKGPTYTNKSLLVHTSICEHFSALHLIPIFLFVFILEFPLSSIPQSMCSRGDQARSPWHCAGKLPTVSSASSQQEGKPKEYEYKRTIAIYRLY